MTRQGGRATDRLPTGLLPPRQPRVPRQLPTGITIGPDGRLYISNKGFGPPQPGEILRVDLRDDGRDDDDMERGG